MSEQGDSTRINLVKLREILLERAVSDDLRIFCADLGVNYEEVVGPNDKLQVAIISIVRHLDVRGRIGDLITRAQREFPTATWADIALMPKQTLQASVPANDTSTVNARLAVMSYRKPGPLRIFLCYAHDDKPAVKELHQKLKQAGMQPWLDEENLAPGQKWRTEIPQAIGASDVMLVCLSRKSVMADGYIRREIAFALDIIDKQPDDVVFIIPVRLEECEFPNRIDEWHGVDLYDPRGYDRLLSALRARRQAVLQATSSPFHTVLSGRKFRIELMKVPQGRFVMGSDKKKDKLAADIELPVHVVNLEEFLMGKYPTTVSQFAAFIRATGYQTTAEREGYGWVWDGKEWGRMEGANWLNPRGTKTSGHNKQNHPVTQVSWHDAMAFCRWLHEMSGQDATLPSEAQWEKAARGAYQRIWPWGDKFDKSKANCSESRVGDTTPVGNYSVKGSNSPYGCADMAGNVWEWTRSLWGQDRDQPEYGYPYSERLDSREDEAATDDVRRVLRGGSYCYPDSFLRCACRLNAQPMFRSDNHGFRVAVRLNIISSGI